jgi:hypothetical protein
VSYSSSTLANILHRPILLGIETKGQSPLSSKTKTHR